MTGRLVPRRVLVGSLASLSGAAVLWPLRGWSEACAPTSADDRGPFHLAGAPQRTQIAAPDEPGDVLLVSGRVLGPDCSSPLARAELDIWQADADGNYHDASHRLRGRVLTDDDGTFSFRTIVPGRYRLSGSYRPAHIHLIVGHARHQQLTTQLYFKGDPYLGERDACGDGCNSRDASRIVELKKSRTDRGFESQVELVLSAQ